MFLHIHCHGIVYAKVYFFGKVYEYTFPKPTKINIIYIEPGWPSRGKNTNPQGLYFFRGECPRLYIYVLVRGPVSRKIHTVFT